jgi:hypothetical protein
VAISCVCGRNAPQRRELVFRWHVTVVRPWSLREVFRQNAGPRIIFEFRAEVNVVVCIMSCLLTCVQLCSTAGPSNDSHLKLRETFFIERWMRTFYDSNIASLSQSDLTAFCISSCGTFPVLSSSSGTGNEIALIASWTSAGNANSPSSSGPSFPAARRL